jgi:hypothetical protein
LHGLKAQISANFQDEHSEEQRVIMKNIVEAKGFQELWAAVKTIPFRLSDKLRELGPVVRLQMLFNIVSEKYAELEDRTTCVAQLINKNLSYLDNLEQLKILHLGERGASFFENIYKILPQR